MTSAGAPVQAERLLQDAERLARSLKHSYIGVEHVFLVGIQDKFLENLLNGAGIKPEALQTTLRDLLPPGEEIPPNSSLPRTPRLKRVLDRAMEMALSEKQNELLPRHLFKSILEEKNGLVALALQEMGSSPEAVANAIPQERQSAHEIEEKQKEKNTPLLNKLGRDLTQLAREGKLDPVIGRTDELRRLMQILSRKTKNVPLLIGEPGVGKTAVVFLLAERLASGNVPQSLLGKRLIELSLGGIVAGTAHRGELEERVQKIVQEAEKNPEIILFIDEIHGLVGAGNSSGGLDVGNMLKPSLADGSLRIIGATTTEEYQKYLAKDPALERRLQPILVKEPSEEETLQILQGIKPRFESFHGVSFSDESLQSAVKLSVRYLPDRHLPDKAIDLLDEAASRVKTKTNLGNKPIVEKEDIAEVVSLWTGIPVQKLSEEDKSRFLHLEEHLKQRVVGQDEAIEKIAEVIRISRTGLANPKKPIGVFLFLGPTGVGKTELAKALADFLFGSPESFIRIDMSEYKEKHTMARLIGAPPGYIGHDEEGQLTKAVHARPYSLVLLDEVEKAHPEILDLFLQIFDDGRLTDSKGRTVNFTNTIIIMTSNIGAKRILESLEQKISKDALKAQILEETKTAFRPEFLNRIDEILIFNPLSQESLLAIVELQLNDLKERLAEQKITLETTRNVAEFLIQKGFDPIFGARPLKRAVQQYLAKPLAQALLEGKFSVGMTVVATVKGEEIFLEPKG
jgi:ATP-dependent Clp protease ATP-binding subunit ClpC